MCMYEMDPTSIVEDTEWTQFCPQRDRQMDRRTDRQTRWNQYTPFNFIEVGGIITLYSTEVRGVKEVVNPSVTLLLAGPSYQGDNALYTIDGNP